MIRGEKPIKKTTYNVVNELCNLNGIGITDIFSDFLTIDDSKKSVSLLASVITRRINKIIIGCKGFKIGKTGNPNIRANAYSGYSQMFLLCKSRNKGVIEMLEAYYIQKYISHPLNDNINMGSASIMSNSHRLYFLYIVIR